MDVNQTEMSIVCGLIPILYIMCNVLLCFISYVVSTFMFVYLLAIQAIVFIKPEMS